jgi:dTDP-L-rhamnose 4-epimerase
MARILITGGAGFIGSHLADELLQSGHAVKVFDLLCSQVHGAEKQSPEFLNPDVELVLGDVRDRAAVQRALQGIDAVYHFAAAVGVGQSMYEVEHYASVNDIGTAVLLEALIKRPVQRLIVASSMRIRLMMKARLSNRSQRRRARRLPSVRFTRCRSMFRNGCV